MKEFPFSPLVQGYWRLDQWGMTAKQLLDFVRQHLELGIDTVDHAHVYGQPSCEGLFGEALSFDPSLRDKLKVISKCGIVLAHNNTSNASVNHYDTSAPAIFDSVHSSLKRLRTDRLDLLLIHRPDYLLRAEEVAAAFAQLKAAGKVLNFGVSNFTSSQFQLLQSAMDDVLVTNQIEISPMRSQVLDNGVLDLMQEKKLRPMAWSCLGGGEIFDQSNHKFNALHDCLSGIADEVGADGIEQVLFAWVMALPSRPVPIVGSGNIKRVKLAVEACKLRLSREQWYQIWVAARGHDVP